MKSLTVEGKLIQIGTMNKNNWGIQEGDAGNIIGKLPGLPLRKCSGLSSMTNPHSCDYEWQSKDDIGKILSARRDGDWIYATAEVTDSIAARKIFEGTWKPGWSIFMSHKNEADTGFIQNPTPRSVTIVERPAYPDAGFNLMAASDNSSGTISASARLEKALKRSMNLFKGVSPEMQEILDSDLSSEQKMEAAEKRLNSMFRGRII